MSDLLKDSNLSFVRSSVVSANGVFTYAPNKKLIQLYREKGLGGLNKAIVQAREKSNIGNLESTLRELREEGMGVTYQGIN